MNIRMTDAIVHVVRCFVDDDIIHVDGNVDPLRDVEVISLELILADLSQIEKRLERVRIHLHILIFVHLLVILDIRLDVSVQSTSQRLRIKHLLIENWKVLQFRSLRFSIFSAHQLLNMTVAILFT